MRKVWPTDVVYAKGYNVNMFGENVRVAGNADKRVRRYQREIGRGLDARKERIDNWEKNEKYAFSNLDIVGGDDNTQVNKLGSWIEARTAALAYRNPRAKLTPRTASGWEPVTVPVVDPASGPVMDPVIDQMTGLPQLDMMGRPVMQPRTKQIPRFKVREHLLNYMLSRPKFRASANGRLGIKAANLHGIGCFKVGYTADYEYDDDAAPPIPAEDIALLDQEMLKEQYEYSPDGSPMIDERGMLVPKGRFPIDEQWFIEWCDTKKMVFDPDGENDFKDHKWVAYEYVLTLDEVKANPFYENVDDLKATGETGASGFHDSQEVINRFWGNSTYSDGPTKRDKLVRLFEIWDFENGKLVVLADGHDKLLHDSDIPDGVCKSTGPWAFYRPVEMLGKWYGHEPASDLRILNEWYNQANKQSMREMRKATWKMLADKRLIESSDLDRLTSPRNEVVPVDLSKTNASSIDSVVRAVTFPSVMPEMFNYSKVISQNFDEVAGQPGESRGVASADTATQVKQLSARETLREDFQRAIYAETWREILQKLDNSIATNMTMEQAITVTDGDGYSFVTMVDADMIQGDFDVDLDVEDMAPRNKEAEKANFVQAMTVASQAPWLVMDPLGAEAFFEMFGVHDRRLASAISQGAQLQMQMAASSGPGKQPGTPSTAPPRDEATAISQRGGM